jgi:hypothetical protein
MICPESSLYSAQHHGTEPNSDLGEPTNNKTHLKIHLHLRLDTSGGYRT